MNSEQVSFKSSAETGQRLCDPDIGRELIQWTESGKGNSRLNDFVIEWTLRTLMKKRSAKKRSAKKRSAKKRSAKKRPAVTMTLLFILRHNKIIVIFLM